MLGPASPPEIAQRLVSADRTVQLVAMPLSTSFVAPITQEIVALDAASGDGKGLAVPAGLELHWTGDAVIGRDYMANVQTSLDRAAIATVVLLADRPPGGLSVVLAGARAAGDDRREPGHRARAPRLDDSRGLGNLAAGRAVSDRDALRHGHRLLPVPVVAVCRALEPEQSGGLDAGDAGPVVHGRGHERGHDHHRHAADGDDPVQALFEHGTERCAGADAGACWPRSR